MEPALHVAFRPLLRVAFQLLPVRLPKLCGLRARCVSRVWSYWIYSSKGNSAQNSKKGDPVSHALLPLPLWRLLKFGRRPRVMQRRLCRLSLASEKPNRASNKNRDSNEPIKCICKDSEVPEYPAGTPPKMRSLGGASLLWRNGRYIWHHLRAQCNPGTPKTKKEAERRASQGPGFLGDLTWTFQLSWTARLRESCEGFRDRAALHSEALGTR